MTTLPPEAPVPSIQPGGGTCFSLERGWGVVRRRLLRRYFPAYVARMAERRRGECPGCTHDIIDGRDLKLVRNVCGYSFAPEDDLFAWRGDIGLARAGLCEVICASAVLLPLVAVTLELAVALHPAWWAVVLVTLGLWVFIVAFFRDPHRVIPTDPKALLSPADGVITHLEEVDEPGFEGKMFRVSIFLSVFNVHVNRMPRAGRVARVAYYPGEFLDARAADCARRNEQLWIDFDDEQLGCRLRVKQVAGAIARRIVCWLKVGEAVPAGDRVGMIKFGSRTDVLLPADRVEAVAVRVGQAVRGGSDVLLRVK